MLLQQFLSKPICHTAGNEFHPGPESDSFGERATSNARTTSQLPLSDLAPRFAEHVDVHMILQPLLDSLS